jgi:RNA 2',3'-cyclic 3'-phosphodiesterase
MGTLRTFLAIDFPSHIIEKINGIQKSLNNLGPTNIRWVKPENIHLTLKFLGNIELSRIQQIKNDMDAISNEYQPFHIKLKGIGAFPHWRQPRIIWIGIEKSEILILLANKLEMKMRALGCQREIRPFSPHLTIGRFRDNTSPEGFQRLEIECRTTKRIDDQIEVSNFCLYKSDLHAFGPEYTLLYSSSFKTTEQSMLKSL